MSNYNPGIALEWAVGPDEELDCDYCEFFGFVATTIILPEHSGLAAVQEYTCPECEHDYSRERNVEDVVPNLYND